MARCALQVGSPSAACDSCWRASDRGSVRALASSALGSINGTAVHRVCRVEGRTVTPAAWPHHRPRATCDAATHLSSPGRAALTFRSAGGRRTGERMCATGWFGGGRVIGSRAFCKQYVQAPPGRPLAQRALLNTRVRPRLFSCQRPCTRSVCLWHQASLALWHQARCRGFLLPCPLSQAMAAAPPLSSHTASTSLTHRRAKSARKTSPRLRWSARSRTPPRVSARGDAWQADRTHAFARLVSGSVSLQLEHAERARKRDHVGVAASAALAPVAAQCRQDVESVRRHTRRGLLQNIKFRSDGT